MWLVQALTHANLLSCFQMFSALFSENARCTNMSSFKIYHLLPHCQCFLCTFGGTGGKDMGSSTLGMGGGFGKWAGHFLPACAGLCFVEVGIAFCLIMASLPKNKRAAKSRVLFQLQVDMNKRVWTNRSNVIEHQLAGVDASLGAASCLQAKSVKLGQTPRGNQQPRGSSPARGMTMMSHHHHAQKARTRMIFPPQEGKTILNKVLHACEARQASKFTLSISARNGVSIPAITVCTDASCEFISNWHMFKTKVRHDCVKMSFVPWWLRRDTCKKEIR